jgi:peptidoglycan/xylan/chitin deacetylase (PgdA/CDA1 family)
VVRDALVRLRKRRGRGGDGFPSWPVEPSIEVLRAVYLRSRQALEPALRPRSPWPDGKRFALVLTHDIDSSNGQSVALELAAAEREHGLRSAWYVVGRDWPLDHEALGSLRADGHELGLHDTHHDNRGAFLAPDQLGERLDACGELVERYGMTGYRSPSMLRTKSMYQALLGRFGYDSSMPDTGLLPKRNGCATVFPINVDGVPVLPLTLPPDGQLAGLGLDPTEIAEQWVAKTEWVARAGGIAMVLTHPEPGFSAEAPMQDAYRRFLAWAASRDDAWHALPHEVAARWAKRGA